MPAIYFSLAYVQPFADMSTEKPEDGVTVVRGDGQIVGLRLDDPRLVLRLSEICANIGVDEEKVWPRLRADADVLLGSRAATWGGGGA
ncbi:MAG: hypothetical protein ACLGG9_04850 [Thermoleophilia bacterium]|jgi:hypothetical protein